MGSSLSRLAFNLLVPIGKPFGGVRPRRMYHALARRAFTAAEPRRWYRDRWGHEFHLSPYYWIDRQIIIFGEYDAHLVRLLEHLVRPGSVCLDVGANLGAITLQLARIVGRTGVVHSFEPVGAAFDRLKEHVTRNQASPPVTIHQVALSNQAGTAEIRCPEQGDFNQGTSSLVNDQARELSRTETIQLETLDAFAERHKLTKLDLIKLDIQGAEPLMLRGAETTLRRFRPIIVTEASREDLVGLGMSLGDYITQLEDLGYAVHRIRQGAAAARVRPTGAFVDGVDNDLVCLPV